MKVKIYDVADDGTETFRAECFLGEAFEDHAEYQNAWFELLRSGRYWLGGGAAPLVLLMRA